MKRYLLSLSLFLVATMASAQQLVLIEEFTNTGCGPCATWSPELDSAINYRLGQCIAVKYHSAFPNKQDEFYLYQAKEHQEKVDYYNVTGVPATFVNGIEINNRSFAGMNEAIDYFLQQPEKYATEVSKTLAGQQLSVSLKMQPLMQAKHGDLRLNVMVVEEHIDLGSPAPNGETELNYTVRRMLTPAGGLAVESASADELPIVEWNGSWDIDAFDNLSELGVVAFLQDRDSREILACNYAGPDVTAQNKLSLLMVEDTPDLICMPLYSGSVILRNDGANQLTSAVLNVEVNGSVKQYPWTGNLGYLERDTLRFSDFTDFELATAGANKVRIWFSSVNGSSNSSNCWVLQFQHSVQAENGVQLKIYTDKKPEETTWNIYDSEGTLVWTGGPYTEQRKIITEQLPLKRDDCYQLELLDAGGDGIKGAFGNGYYQLLQVGKDGKTQRITQGDFSGAAHYVNFRLNNAPKDNRLVLVEEFTNTSCDPCADFSPSFDDMLYRRMNEVATITYHHNFPSNRDPFYLANVADEQARASYYDISGVPSIFFNGFRGHTQGEMLDDYIDYYGNMDEPMGLSIAATLDGDNLKVTAEVLPQDISDGSDLKLFIVAVEERIEFADAQPNGERSWNFVMRKMMPSASGIQLPNDLTTQPSFSYEASWTADNYYDLNELAVVAFVQETSTGEVYCARYLPRPTGAQQAAKILKVTDTPLKMCRPQFAATVDVRNTGSVLLTSANINVSVNGSVTVIPWKGRIAPLEHLAISTGTITDFLLATGGTNEIELWLSDLNGTAEATPHKALSVANAPVAQNSVRLTLKTDGQPEEIAWKVINSAGDVVCTSQPYTEANKKHEQMLPLDVDDCYQLVFTDAGGNGITGDYGRGYFMLHQVGTDGKTRLLLQADYTGATYEAFFGLENALPAAITTIEADAAEGPLYNLKGQKVDTPVQKGIYVQDNKKTIK